MAARLRTALRPTAVGVSYRIPVLVRQAGGEPHRTAVPALPRDIARGAAHCSTSSQAPWPRDCQADELVDDCHAAHGRSPLQFSLHSQDREGDAPNEVSDKTP